MAMAGVSCLLLLTLPGLVQAELPESGLLTGDVVNWAVMIQNYISQLASDGIKRDITQSLFDTANYTYEKKNGTKTVAQVQEQLSRYFRAKRQAAQELSQKVALLYDSTVAQNQSADTHVGEDQQTASTPHSLADLKPEVYRDSDIPSRLPEDLMFDSKFQQRVSRSSSTVKISDDVPRTSMDTVAATNFSYGLEELMKSNAAVDPSIRWQYFGSTAGVFRLYPGREWDINFAGFFNDYDPRVRPWYIAATSGPKDVVIILDCSLSMADNGKFVIAQAVAKTVIDTLTKQDYVNVICARASHWDVVGKWFYRSTNVLSCQQDRMVPATTAYRKDLIEKVYKLVPSGTSELEKGFELAFNLLQGKARTGCQSLIVFVTDGKDTDGETIRCGPGYYTRSGYVPGPVCKYNWTKVWDLVKEKNERMKSPARIFSYLTKDAGELFPGKLACDNRGSLKKLVSGENLISEMNAYFGFLSTNAMVEDGLWTSPYLDTGGLGVMVTHALPVVSKVNKQTIGVIGVDCTLAELEYTLMRHQWGSVYSFLINKEGETIFHPLLKPSSGLKEDPIFIPISQLEQDKDGNPRNFSVIERAMRAGLSGGVLYIPQARRGTSKGDFREGVKYEIIPATYYYTSLNDSEFAFAFNLAETDKEYRAVEEPVDRTPYDKSYFNLLAEYNSSIARKELPGVYEYLQVFFDEPKYPRLFVSYLHSSIFLAPRCYCDPVQYFYDDDLEWKTVDAHKYLNGFDPDVGCEDGARYERGVRAHVLITQPIEEEWRKRDFESLDKVKWTYVGMRSGVFRTYPGHPSNRNYDPTRRPWYLRAVANPDKTVISTAYMDAAGVGKIITISQAVFEGMVPRTTAECEEYHNVTKPGGCVCTHDEECISGQCYLSKAPGPNSNHRRCATERVEAVTSLDILYNDFHAKVMGLMQSSDGRHARSCGAVYNCSNGAPACQTRCYIFDNRANMIVDPDFIQVMDIETAKYSGVTMGKKEGEIMKELIFKHRLFTRQEDIDFQGTCSLSGGQRVTLEGLPTNPQEQDNYLKTRGPIPKFSNDFGCIQDVVGFSINSSALAPGEVLTGNISTGPCMQGFYYVTALPKTNLFLLVIENWKNSASTAFYNFNCHISRSIANAGAFRIVNGTCEHEDSTSITLEEANKCPALKNVEVPCTYQQGRVTRMSWSLLIMSLCVPSLT